MIDAAFYDSSDDDALDNIHYIDDISLTHFIAWAK